MKYKVRIRTADTRRMFFVQAGPENMLIDVEDENGHFPLREWGEPEEVEDLSRAVCDIPEATLIALYSGLIDEIEVGE